MSQDSQGSLKTSSRVTGMRFDDMNLSEDLLYGTYASGFETSFATQQGAILPCVKGL